MMNVGFTNSEENDYTAETFSFGVSQDIFGDLTTVSLGYSLGNDTVEPARRREFQRHGRAAAVPARRLADPDEESVARLVVRDDHRRGVPEQSVSPGSLPRYRPRRRATATSARSTRARARATRAAIRLRYYLPWRAAVHAEYRQYADTWDIQADTFELGYTHPIESGWTFEGKFRSYSQTKADFYSDLFSRSQFQNFMARDKELSTFTSQTIRLGASYDIVRGGWKFVERGTVNVDRRPHDVRLRGFPRPARNGRRARQRAVLHLRRQRRPGLRFLLVLTATA